MRADFKEKIKRECYRPLSVVVKKVSPFLIDFGKKNKSIKGITRHSYVRARRYEYEIKKIAESIL